MNALNIVLVIFATSRLSSLIAEEAGPFRILDRTRNWLQDRVGQDHWLADGLNCRFCVSFWVALIAVLVFDYVPLVVWLWLLVAEVVRLIAVLEFNKYAN